MPVCAGVGLGAYHGENGGAKHAGSLNVSAAKLLAVVFEFAPPCLVTRDRSTRIGWVAFESEPTIGMICRQ